MHAALVIMAAGIGSRYGGSKQTDGVGPHAVGLLGAPRRDTDGVRCVRRGAGGL